MLRETALFDALHSGLAIVREVWNNEKIRVCILS